MIDSQKLQALEGELARALERIRRQIVDLAGEEINIDSPQQLSQLLFVRLHIPTEGIRRTANGFSTDAEQLQRLKKDYPIANLILHYRELAKLLSTYIRPLPELVDGAGRLHTTYAPDTTSGRLSSRNPNLQNIPIRTEIGRKIRAAFVAPRGKVLVKADYSQVELRLAACFSEEPKMIEAFASGEDIHRRTAAEVFKKPLAAITESERRFAKTVNFGVLYGMGPHGLSVALDISYQEAQDYIDRYFLSHQKLRQYIDRSLKAARESGSVTNCFGRRRTIPELKSPHDQVRRAGERMAINMPIQGTAAEILKLAMIELEPKLAAYDAVLILSVHDELVVEVGRTKVKAVSRVMRQIMEGAVRLCIPLLVEVGSGPNWAETKPIHL